MFAGTIKKRSDALWSKTSWEVRGPILPEARWTIICWRAHERFANSAPMISGVVEKTIALRNPSRCKMRSKRSSKLTPHNSVKASGASAIKIGRIFSIACEINGGAASCQLSAIFSWGVELRLLIDLRNRTSRGPRMAGDNVAVFHLMDPIAGFGDHRIMRGQKQSFAAFLDDILQQFKRALRVGSIQIAGRFVRQNDSRIIGEGACDSHTLLLASGEMTTGSSQFVAQTNCFQQADSAFAHLAIGKLPQFAHRNHHVLLRGEILHQKMELKNEADELAPLVRQLVIAQLSHRLRFDRNASGVGQVEQPEDVEQR